MMKLSFLLSIFLLCSCGDSSNSRKSALSTIKNFRSSLSKLSQISPSNKINVKMAGSDATDWTSPGNFSYGNQNNLSLQDWFEIEFNKDKPMTGSGDNFFNRLDSAFVYMCAIFQDLGEDLDEQTTIIQATAESINTQCGTNLPAQNISITGKSATVTNLDTGLYLKKVQLDGMTLYITNTTTEIKFAFGLYENEGSPVGDRVVLNLDKNSGNFELEFIQYEGPGSETLYRAYKSDSRLIVFGRSPQGSGANYLATLTDTRAALDFDIDNGTTKSVCIDLSNGNKATETYANCFDQAGDFDLTDLSNITNFDVAANISDWTEVDRTTSIDFSSVNDLNSVLF